MTDAPAIPEPLLPLSWLLGTWVGVGVGGYPTIEEFQFGQEVTFATDGRPFLSYWSRTWLLDSEGERVRPLATEAGFWRPRPDNRCELLWRYDMAAVGLPSTAHISARLQKQV